MNAHPSSLSDREPSREPTRIPTAWGDFWAIGDRSARIFLSEEEAAAVIAKKTATEGRDG